MTLALGAKKGLFGICASSSKGMAMSPICVIQPTKRVPCFCASHFFATAPAATVGAVSRAEARPPPRGSRRPYFCQ